jgi:arsenate reductase
MMRIDVLGTTGCPHVSETLARVRQVSERLRAEANIVEGVVSDLDEARRLGFVGSPTVWVQGEDIEREAAPTEAALACRLYDGGGVPPQWLLEAALLRATGFQHVLFLCVANSARSQMAEGIARALAPEGVRVSSAGSAPTRVRPEALVVLAEIGIDVSRQRSKALEEVQGPVDVVVTLCAEEVCPVWLGHARRVHWALPDPATTKGGEAERMEAFRKTRDELVRRLGMLFPGDRGATPARSRSEP